MPNCAPWLMQALYEGEMAIRRLVRLCAFLVCGTAGCQQPGSSASPSPAPGSNAPIDASPAEDVGPEVPLRPLRIVQFTRETFYYHPDAHLHDEDVATYLRSRGHTVTITKDPAVLVSELASADVAFFFVTSGFVFDTDLQRRAFETFIRSGHGFAGAHTASVTETDWEFFKALVGATFLGHAMGASQISDATLLVESPGDRIVGFLPARWPRQDEWYFFFEDPSENKALEPLLSIDERTLPADYPDAGRYGRHFIAWKQRYAGARSFYSALGHTGASYDGSHLEMLARGIEWAGAPSTRDAKR